MATETEPFSMESTSCCSIKLSYSATRFPLHHLLDPGVLLSLKEETPINFIIFLSFFHLKKGKVQRSKIKKLK